MGVGASTALDCSAAASTAVSASAAPALDGPADRRPCEPQRGCAPRGRPEWQRRDKQSGDEAQPLRAQLVDRAKRPGERGVGCAAGRSFRKHGIRPSRCAARFGIGPLAFPEAPDTRAAAPDTRAEAPASREAPSPSAPPAAAASPSAATTSSSAASPAAASTAASPATATATAPATAASTAAAAG
jgi:hypothetical protein